MNKNMWKVKIFFIAFIFSLIFHILMSKCFYLNFNSLVFSLPILGLIFGPVGALGAAFSSFCLCVYFDLDFFGALIYFCYVFITSMIPYVLWYTTLKRSKIERLTFSSMFNVFKFVLITAVISFIDTGFCFLYFESYNFILYDYIFYIEYFLLGIIVSPFHIGLILLLQHLNFQFYLPLKNSVHLNNIPFFNFLNNHVKFYYIFLIIPMVMFFVLFCFSYFVSIFNYPLFIFVFEILILIFLLLFILKPIKKISVNEYDGTNYVFHNKEKFTLTEYLVINIVILHSIIIFLLYNIFRIAISLDLISMSHARIYIICSCIILIIVAIPYYFTSVYIENNIFDPIENISLAIKNYFPNNQSQENIQIIKDYTIKFKENSIIGGLANSIIKMNDDLKKYIQEFTELYIEKERIKTEIDVAQRIQKSFVPKNFESLKDFGINADGISIPAKAVGGDFFNFFVIDDENIAFVIGDASGKGIPASLFMAISISTIKQQIKVEYTYGNSENKLAKAFFKINNILGDGNDEKMFLTSWLGVLNIKTGRLEFINAGHEPPIIKHDKAEFLNMESNFVLGIMKNFEYKSSHIVLEKGDKVFLYTDGVTDATNSSEEFFTSERLLKSLNKNNLTVSEEIENLKETIDEFVQNQEQFDDFTILCFEYL